MKVSWKHYTGHLAHLQPWLHRRVRVFTKKWYWVKIGITNDPEIRADQHERIDPDWELMVVLWETTSARLIRRAESMIIHYLGEYLDNLIGGGGGRQADVGPYFLYVLLSERLSDD